MNKTVKQLTTLSVKNLRSHTWLYTRLALAFAVLVFLLCLFSAYAISLNDMQRNILAEHAAANQIVSSEPITSGLPDGTESFTAKRFGAQIELADDETGEEIVDDGGSDESDGGFVIRPALPLFLTLTVDGVEYTREHWAAYYEYNRIFSSDQLLTDNDRAELIRTRGSDDVLVGRMPQSANEVVVAEQFLDLFELTGEQALSKTLSFVVSLGEESIEIGDLVVCGILKREYGELSGHDNFVVFCPYLLLSYDNPVFTDTERVSDVYVYSLPYWLSESEIDQLTEQYDCWFLGHSWLDDMIRLSIMQSIATKLFVVAGGALSGSVVLMIFLMMDKLIAVFSHDCGILLSCGMQFRQVKLLLLAMLAWVCLFAVVIAAVLTVASVLGINAAIYSYFHMQMTVSPVTVLSLFGIGIAAVTLVALIYYLYAVGKMKRLTVKEFLNTSVN